MDEKQKVAFQNNDIFPMDLTAEDILAVVNHSGIALNIIMHPCGILEIQALDNGK